MRRNLEGHHKDCSCNTCLVLGLQFRVNELEAELAALKAPMDGAEIKEDIEWAESYKPSSIYDFWGSRQKRMARAYRAKVAELASVGKDRTEVYKCFKCESINTTSNAAPICFSCYDLLRRGI